MIAIIYRSRLNNPQDQEEYVYHWNLVGTYFRDHCGSLGTTLHQTADGEWITYSRWPDRETKEAIWPPNSPPNPALPNHIHHSINRFLSLISDKQPEIEMTVISDLFIKD